MHSLMVRWSRCYKWCGSKRGEIVFESPLKIVQRGKNQHFRHLQLKERPPWMFLCKFMHPGTLGYFAFWSPRHIQNFLLCLLESVSTCRHLSECVCVFTLLTEVCLPTSCLAAPLCQVPGCTALTSHGSPRLSHLHS